MRKKLGVMGGMGPEATSYFYENMIKHTGASCDQEHVDMVILSHASMPDRTACIASGDTENLVRLLIQDARTLQTLGVGNIVITCNTSHYFYDEIQSAVDIPVINMIRESAYRAAEMSPGGKVGIMATDGTLLGRLYHRECEKLGLVPVSPSSERQSDVMSLIYDDVKGGREPDRDKFGRVIDEFDKEGCGAVILACTELSVYKGKNPIPENCLDAMDVLVREAIVRSGGVYIEG
jgi:aspartate racemase